MNDQRLYQVLLAPHVSEKTAMDAEMRGRHTFKVSTDASKLEVRKAVEKLFGVNVRSVQIINVVSVRIGRRPSCDSPKVKTSTSSGWKVNHGSR